MDTSIKSQLGRFIENQDLITDRQADCVSSLVGVAKLESTGDQEIFATQVMLLLKLAQNEFLSAQSDQNQSKMALQLAIIHWCSGISMTIN